MALTAYCKKCCREVAPGEVCPRCGTKLGKTAVHAAWCVERRPVADWICWNAVMRVLLPTALAVLLLMLALELLSGGAGAVERLFLGGFPLTLLILLGAALAVVFLALLLQGRDLMDYVVDSRGVHVTRYLPSPTPLRLLARLKSPALMRQADPDAGADAVILLDQRDLAWKDVARVQLWPEKDYVLFYAPGWWMRAAVRCTPFTWDDTMGYIREKLGKKKAVRLPAGLRAQTVKQTGVRSRKAPEAPPAAVRPEIPDGPYDGEQLQMEALPAEDAAPAAPPPGTETENPDS